MLIVYTDICVPCKYKAHLRLLNHVAKQLKVDVKILETKYRPELLAEARERSKLPLPFVYNEDSGQSIELKNIMGGFRI